MTTYFPNPTTVQQHVANVRFQLANVEGYLRLGKADCAAIKAECLLEASQRLMAVLAGELAGKDAGAPGGGQ